MKLLLINQYYWPDSAATAQMLSDLGEHLASAGHDVHVLCSRGKYDHGTAAGCRLPRYERRRQVHIHRITATGFGKKHLLGRLADYFSFHLLLGVRTLLTGWRYDLLVTLTTPPLVGIYATAVKSFCPVRHVCWVMDLHPDCEFELGVFDRRKLLPRMLDYLNGLHFRRATANVVLGPYMAQRLLNKAVPADRIVEIPVWGHDQQQPAGEPAVNPLRESLGMEGKFIVMYSGNAGLIHSFDEITQAALRLREDQRMVFLFVGGGRRMRELEQFQRQHRLENMIFRDYFPREQLGHSLTLGDVHLLSLRQGMAGVAVPSKLYGIMAAGRPAVFIGPALCESAQAIRQADCGRIIDLGDADGLIKVLRELAENPAQRALLGRHARQAFERTYNAHACCEQWRQLLESLRR